MARIFEFACFIFILYLFYKRLAAPFRRGFDAREAERKATQSRKREQDAAKAEAGKIDRSNLKDAEFKDI